MRIRTILAAVSGGAASEGTVRTAAALAKDFSAQLEILHVRPDPQAVLPLLGQDFGSPFASELLAVVAQQAESARSTCRAALAAANILDLTEIETTTARTGAAAGPAAHWREVTGRAAKLIAARARYFDLVVLGRSERVLERPHTDTLEEVILGSGRPVLVAPCRPAAMAFKTIALAWNDSPESAHAVAAALPLLERAQRVLLLGLDRSQTESRRKLSELAAYLDWHGIAAHGCPLRPVEGIRPGELLLAGAREEGADLLVIGGYGHAPLRETLLGGSTRDLLATSYLPLLIAH
jgi:nucleotide-binding universal stress UspA family protein